MTTNLTLTNSKISAPYFGFLFSLLIFVSGPALAQESPFYSVESTISQISESDLGNHRSLEIAAPPVLYHWISIDSLGRLFPSEVLPNQMPLKNLGNDSYASLLVVGAPAFKDVPGLYTWHNPLGASAGGSGEVYGNHEAILAMKIKSKIRIGLVVTRSSSGPSPALAEPNLRNQYDLILHVSGSVYNGKFQATFIEWALVNPDIVTSFSADVTENIKVLKQYQKALIDLKKLGIETNKAPLEVIAGPQHTAMGVHGINEKRVDNLIMSLKKNAVRIRTDLKKGWHKIGSGHFAYAQIFASY